MTTETDRRVSNPSASRKGSLRQLRHAVPAALLATVCALVVTQNSEAQIFPPQGDDTTSSMGVFRITVDPAFLPLVNPVGALVAYPGFNTANGKLTSPLCVDSATTIGRTGPHSRLYTASFPVPLGAGSWDSILGYVDYPAIPFLWAAAPPPTEEVLTEIKSFVLLSVTPGADGKQCPPDPRIPAVPLAWPMVRAGTFAGVSPRSLGIVQENVANGVAAPDFPAHSFFDIFANVSLPPIPGTESSVAFPAGGALLYNDAPLIITNLNLTGFPPQVVYIHGETPAVPLKFKFSNPPYWNTGDVFGYLVLAGHGTITNDCSDTAAVNGLLTAALGPIGAAAPELPVEWLRTNTLCPSPGTTYDSVKGTNSDGTSLDVVQFTIPGAGTIFARNFSHGNLANPINPPPPNATATYTAPASVVSMELSVEGQNWFPAQASGPVAIKISNNSGTGSIQTFDTEMLQLSLTGAGPLGPFMIRESPTKQSLGRHTIRPDSRGFRISSFFDVFLELSTDGGQTWVAANRSIRVQPSAPLAAPNSIFVMGSTKTNITLHWLGEFQLQSAPNLQGTFTDVPGVLTGPYTSTLNGQQRYFRLRQ